MHQKIAKLLNEDLEDKEVLKNLSMIMKQDSLLDILIQIEDFFDKMNLYVYPNWINGVIVQGPNLSKYWIDISFKYPYKEMPDPQGAKILNKLGIKIEYEKDIETKSEEIKSKEDIDMVTGRAKRIQEEVWLVHMSIPRRFIDEIELEKLKIANMDNDIDAEDVARATDDGISDDNTIV